MTDAVLVAVIGIGGTFFGSIVAHFLSGWHAAAQWRRTLSLERERWEKEREAEMERWKRDHDELERSRRLDVYCQFHQSSIEVMAKGSFILNDLSSSDRSPSDENWVAYHASTKEHLSLYTQLLLVTGSRDVTDEAGQVCGILQKVNTILHQRNITVSNADVSKQYMEAQRHIGRLISAAKLELGYDIREPEREPPSATD